MRKEPDEWSREFVFDQLSGWLEARVQEMFGAHGLYRGEHS